METIRQGRKNGHKDKQGKREIKTLRKRRMKMMETLR